MEQYSIYIRKFKIALGILLAALFVFIVLIVKIVPEIQKISETQKSYKETTSSLADAERRLASLRESKARAVENEDLILKAFFKPINSAVDTEAAISDEFGEILQIMRDNKVKARSFEFQNDPEDDNFYKYAGNKYHVSKITAEMVATYSEFENFLRDLFKHEHFLEISKIEITPYPKNKRILLVTLQFKLYAQRDPSSVVEKPAEQSQKADKKSAKSPDVPPNIEPEQF